MAICLRERPEAPPTVENVLESIVEYNKRWDDLFRSRNTYVDIRTIIRGEDNER